MKAQITKIMDKPSKYTGKKAYLVCFKCDDGTSKTSWVDEGYRNYPRWEGKLKVGNVLSGLNSKDGKYIDADSFPMVFVEPQEPAQSVVEPETPTEPQTAELFTIEPTNASKRKLGKEYWA